MYAYVRPDTEMFVRGLVGGRKPPLKTTIERAIRSRADELEDAAEVRITVEWHRDGYEAITPEIRKQLRAWSDQALRACVGRTRPALRIEERPGLEDEDVVVRIAVVNRLWEVPSGEGRTVLLPTRPTDGGGEEPITPGEFSLQFSVGGAFGLTCRSVHALRAPEVAIGRRLDSTLDDGAILLPADRSISRHHLTLRLLRGGAFAEFELEVKGRHGIRVGGRVVAQGERVRVHVGQAIELGARARGRMPTMVIVPTRDLGEEGA